jgi:hypothetical protein
MKEERKDIYILISPKKWKAKETKLTQCLLLEHRQSLLVELHIPQLLAQAHWRDTSETHGITMEQQQCEGIMTTNSVNTWSSMVLKVERVARTMLDQEQFGKTTMDQ